MELLSKMPDARPRGDMGEAAAPWRCSSPLTARFVEGDERKIMSTRFRELLRALRVDRSKPSECWVLPELGCAFYLFPN